MTKTFFDRREFIKRLEHAFEQSGLSTQSEIADVLSITKQAAGKWFNEKETNKPTYERLVQIADITNVSIDYLIRGEKNEFMYCPQIPLITYSEVINGVLDKTTVNYIPAMFSIKKGFAVRVEDDSMDKTDNELMKGSIAVFNKEKIDAKNGELVFASVGSEKYPIFAQYLEHAGRVFLSPLNPRYESIKETFSILGIYVYSIIEVKSI